MRTRGGDVPPLVLGSQRPHVLPMLFRERFRQPTLEFLPRCSSGLWQTSSTSQAREDFSAGPIAATRCAVHGWGQHSQPLCRSIVALTPRCPCTSSKKVVLPIVEVP